MGSAISSSSAGVPLAPDGFVRKPRRITVTVSQRTAERLLQRSLKEGRSLSSLEAVLLERAIKAEQANPPELHWPPSRLWPRAPQNIHG